MKRFHCQCGNPVFFRNTRCTRCQRDLGYDPLSADMLSKDPASGMWETAGSNATLGMRSCRNQAEHDVCNWLVPEQDLHPYCQACRLNAMIPNLDEPRHHDYWYRIEAAKRHLLYSLLQLGLPVIGKDIDPQQGLSFVFIRDLGEADIATGDSEFGDHFGDGGRVMTGHKQGRITINIAEADHVERTRARELFNEPYRTLLGHFRHEIGHYYWDLLVRDGPWLDEFRRLFGDERQDYAAARDRHYVQGPASDWQDRCISAYASMHPWEDWAESWAHYLHIIDTLETARAFGLATGPAPARQDFASLIEDWQTLTPGLNALCRSMGVQDIYPFVIHPAAREKLGLVQRIIQGSAQPLT